MGYFGKDKQSHNIFIKLDETVESNNKHNPGTQRDKEPQHWV